jgi:hypothetical protein
MTFKAMILQQRQQMPRKAGVLAVAPWSAPDDCDQDDKSLDDVHDLADRSWLSPRFFCDSVTVTAINGIR